MQPVAKPIGSLEVIKSACMDWMHGLYKPAQCSWFSGAALIYTDCESGP